VDDAPPSTHTRRPGPLLLALIALASLLFDGVVVHAHQHRAPALAAPGVQTGDATLDEPCALCGAAATLDALLLPVPPRWHQPTVIPIVMPVIAHAFAAPRSRAHDWQSRAPPGSSARR